MDLPHKRPVSEYFRIISKTAVGLFAFNPANPGSLETQSVDVATAQCFS
jgi:hypothetical protein